MAFDGSFRSALHGFNRQDVTEYLESASARYNTLKKERTDIEKQYRDQLAKVKELEDAGAEMELTIGELREELSRVKAVREAMEQDLQQERSAHNELEAQLALARKELEGAKASLTEAAKREAAASGESEEMKALREKLHEAGSKAAEYDLLRQRLATLELDASRRAAEIERTAREEAEDHRLRILAEAEAAKEAALIEADAIRSQAKKDAEAMRLQAEEQNAALALKRKEASQRFHGTLVQTAQDTNAEAERLHGEAEQFLLRMKEFISSIKSSAERFAPQSCDSEITCGETGLRPDEVHHCHVDT